MKKICATVCLFLVFPVAAFAAAVTGYSGNMQNGAIITVTGTDLPSRTTAAPIRFDTFESSSAGTTLDSLGYTHKGDSGHAVASISRGLSTKSAYKLNCGGNCWNSSVLSPLGLDTMFLSFWVRWASGGSSTVVKWLRITSDLSGEDYFYGGFPGMWITANPITGWWYAALPYETTEDHYSTQQDMGLLPANTWIKYDVYFKASGADTANGTVTVDYNNSREYSAVNVATRHSTSYKINNVVMPMMLDEGSVDHQIWFDDLYLDNTPVRVEICNSGRTHCEIQPISASSVFSSTSITNVTVNRGSFGATDTAYLYVYDANNSPSTPAAITFGDSGGGDTTDPVVTIELPVEFTDTYSTSSSTVTLAGTATDAVGVTSVTWSNDRGGSGTATCTGCTGTSVTWEKTGITLYSGVNIITILATDGTNTGTDTLTVTYTPLDTTPPVVTLASVNGSTVTISFSESVTTTNYVSGDFNLDCTSPTVSNIALSSPVGSGTDRTFTAAQAIVYGQTCNLDYLGRTNGIEDAAGNDLVARNDIAVTNNTASDTTPDQFTFTDLTGVTRSTVYTSDPPITVTGINTSVAVSITGGTYSKNGAAYTSNAGTALVNDTFAVRHTSSAAFATAVNTVLTIGGVSDTYTTTTQLRPGISSGGNVAGSIK